MITAIPLDTGHLHVNYLKEFGNASYSLRAHAELPNCDFPFHVKSFTQFCLAYPSLRNSEIYTAYAGNLTLDADFGENMMKKLCKGGCGKIATYRGWCKIKWRSNSKFCPSCPKLEEKRAKSISLYRLQEAKLGLNPMQNPEICKRNHSEERNRKAALALKKLGKMGLLPQQIEPQYLKDRRLRKIRKTLRKLAVEKRLPQQIESSESKAIRIQRIKETLIKLAKQGKLKLQNMTDKERREYGRRMSISLKKAVAEGRVKPNLGGFKTPYKRLNGESIVLRSKWEAEVAKLLDKLNVSWQYEPFYVKYFNTEKKLMSNTLPDFYLPEQNLIIEVKGASITLTKTRDKIRWLHKQGYNVLLIGRKEIKFIRRNEIDLLTKKIFEESEKLCQKLN